MADIIKVRNILKAQMGLQLPSNFKFNTLLSPQLPSTLNLPYLLTLTNNALSSISSLLGNPYIMQGTLQANPLLSNTLPGVTLPAQNNTENTANGKQSTFLKMGGWGMVGQAADMLGGIFKDPNAYAGPNGLTKQMGDQMFDSASSAVMAANPMVGGIMKAGGLVSDVLSGMGMGTDNMTSTDAILGSKLLSLTPIGMINGFGGKKTLKFSVDKNTIALVGGSYGGSINAINDAASKANKKYGLFSSGARRRANRAIDEARRQQNIMADIADEATDRSSIALDMSQLNHIRYLQQMSGGYDLRYMRAAKFGAKLKRIKKIKINKKGGEINGIINLNKEWSPIIELESFKNGGLLGWSPIIELESFKNGGLLGWSPIIELEQSTEEIYTFKNGGSLDNWNPVISIDNWNPVICLQEGGSLDNWNFDTWFNSIPEKNRADGYDYKMAFDVLEKELLLNHAKDPSKYHLPSVAGIEDNKGRIPFLKLGRVEDNPEISAEFTEFYNHPRGKEFRNKYDVIYEGDRYYYVPKKDRTLDELIEYAKKENPRFILRMSEPVRYVELENGLRGTHLLSYAEADGNYFVYPEILEDEKGNLKRYSSEEAVERAFKNKNVLWFNSENEAKLFTESAEDENGNLFGYKKGWPNFFKKFLEGGKITELKNIIPEGALHAHKHHMENADKLTKKGIPVIDNDGEQLAEIEKEEIIFNLEVTQKLEKLCKIFYDKESSNEEKDNAAILAGKLLVDEILFNTDDRADLISKCKDGGKLNEFK